MSVSVQGIISALAIKPMPPMLARSIANNFASLAAEAATAPEASGRVAEASRVEAPSSAEGAAAEFRLDTRA